MASSLKRKILPLIIISNLILIYYVFTKTNFLNNQIIARHSNAQLRTRKPIVCNKTSENWIILTTIHHSKNFLNNLSKLSDRIVLIIGEVNSFDSVDPNLIASVSQYSNFILLSLDEQLELDFDLVDIIPDGIYARKNLGYLYAIKCGAKMIYDVDDEIKNFENVKINPNVSAITPKISKLPLVNPYAFYGNPEVFSNGYPNNLFHYSNTFEFYDVEKYPNNKPMIHQDLGCANLHPYSAHILNQHKLNLTLRTYPDLMSIQNGYFMPLLAKNTIYQFDAFWAMIIPCTTEPCEMFRGYFIQRLLWDLNGSVTFKPSRSTLNCGSRNDISNYVADLVNMDELNFKTDKLLKFLSRWKVLSEKLYENLIQLGNQMVTNGFWTDLEIRILQTWIRDLKNIGYDPPLIKKKAIEKDPSEKTAICLTGQLDRISKAWPDTKESLNKVFQKRKYDIFYYVSTYKSLMEDDEKYLKTELFPSFGIIYNDPSLNPNTSTNVYGYQIDAKRVKGLTKKNLFQQWYALKRCYEMVEDYCKRHDTSYKYMLRLRTDHYLKISNQTLIDQAWNAIEKDSKIVIPYDPLEVEHFSKPKKFTYVDEGWYGDRIAFGPFEKMKYVMKKYDDMNMPGLKTLHPERYLYFLLHDHYKVGVMRMNWTYDEVPHTLPKS